MKIFKKLVVIFAVLACLYFGVTVLTSSYSQEEEHTFEYRGVAAFSDYSLNHHTGWRTMEIGQVQIPPLPEGATLETHKPHVNIVWDKGLNAGGQNISAKRHEGLDPQTNFVVMWMRWVYENGATSLQMSDLISITDWETTYPAQTIIDPENYEEAFNKGDPSVYWGPVSPEGFFPPGESTFESSLYPLVPESFMAIELKSLWVAPDWGSTGHPWPFRYDIPMEYTVDVTWLPN